MRLGQIVLRWTCARQSWHSENSPGVQVNAADVLRHKASFKGGQSRKQLEHEKSKGMVLPFRQLNVAFTHMYYNVDLPSVSTLLQLTWLLLHTLAQHGDLKNFRGYSHCCKFHHLWNFGASRGALAEIC